MGAAKGNQNAKGNKGGGRPSAREEFADAFEAHEIFFSEQNQEELEAKIESGRFSLADRFKLNAMEGSTVELITAAKKALPDVAKIDHTTKGEKMVVPLLDRGILQDNSSNKDTEAK